MKAYTLGAPGTWLPAGSSWAWDAGAWWGVDTAACRCCHAVEYPACMPPTSAVVLINSCRPAINPQACSWTRLMHR